MRIAMGADHRGTAAINMLADKCRRAGHDVRLYGSVDGQPCDYPEPAAQVAKAISRHDADRGILVCGTGIGMSIAANKVKGVRAAVVHDEFTAELSRSHNDANVLCMSGDLLGLRLIDKIVDVWLKTEFEGGRHARRIDKIAQLEQGGAC
jgi:ribose 5-phosphate isomerase B